MTKRAGARKADKRRWLRTPGKEGRGGGQKNAEGMGGKRCMPLSAHERKADLIFPFSVRSECLVVSEQHLHRSWLSPASRCSG